MAFKCLVVLMFQKKKYNSLVNQWQTSSTWPLHGFCRWCLFHKLWQRWYVVQRFDWTALLSLCYQRWTLTGFQFDLIHQPMKKMSICIGWVCSLLRLQWALVSINCILMIWFYIVGKNLWNNNNNIQGFFVVFC